MNAERLPVGVQFQKTKKGWTWRLGWGYYAPDPRKGVEPTLKQAVSAALESWKRDQNVEE